MSGTLHHTNFFIEAIFVYILLESFAEICNSEIHLSFRGVKLATRKYSIANTVILGVTKQLLNIGT